MPGRKSDRLSPMIGPDISTFPLAFMVEGYVCEGIYSIVPGGFEPPSRAPKALRIDLYPTGLIESFDAFFILNLLQPASMNFGRPAAKARCVRITYIWPFPEDFRR